MLMNFARVSYSSVAFDVAERLRLIKQRIMSPNGPDYVCFQEQAY